jgi:RNA polymerase sigma factor (sigma-70 family)
MVDAPSIGDRMMAERVFDVSDGLFCLEPQLADKGDEREDDCSRCDSFSIRVENSADEPSDHDLVQRVCQRDKRAFEMLYQRFHTPIRRFVYRLNCRLDNVEEIINDVMLVVWQKAESFNGTSKVSTWILGITYNKVLNAGAQWSGDSEVNFDDVEPFLPGVVDAGMREYELQNWLSVAFERLSADQRAAMELTCLHGMHYEEIAEILGCPENTVKTRMFHARKKLKEILPELGLHEPFSNGRRL